MITDAAVTGLAICAAVLNAAVDAAVGVKRAADGRARRAAEEAREGAAEAKRKQTAQAQAEIAAEFATTEKERAGAPGTAEARPDGADLGV